jgi:hypothetical protein
MDFIHGTTTAEFYRHPLNTKLTAIVMLGWLIQESEIIVMVCVATSLKDSLQIFLLSKRSRKGETTSGAKTHDIILLSLEYVYH